MNEHKKSLKLAEMMGWGVIYTNGYPKVDPAFNSDFAGYLYLQPYESDTDGLAQFAAILLKFREVIPRICRNKWHKQGMQNVCRIELRDVEPTQANILDEILVMNGVEI